MAAETRLREKGLKLTRQRAAIMDVFSGNCELKTAGEIARYLKEQGYGVNRSTVYRNLELLTQEGILRKVALEDGVMRYETATHPGGCQHHLVCTSCGQAIEFHDCDLAVLEQKLAEQTHYLIERHRLEVYGLCPGCQPKKGE